LTDTQRLQIVRDVPAPRSGEKRDVLRATWFVEPPRDVPTLLLDADATPVLAAAIRASAQVIVTENWRDFPAAVLEEYGIETLGADDMLVSTYELFPSEAARALSRVRNRYKSPPMTASEFLFDLTKSGLPKLAATLRRDIEAL